MRDARLVAPSIRLGFLASVGDGCEQAGVVGRTGAVYCIGGNFAYVRAAAQAKCEHVIAKRGGDSTTHLGIGRIDASHRDVENLVIRCCMGVSTAT